MNATCITNVRLTAENVNTILNKCLYTSSSSSSHKPLIIEGYKNDFSFDTVALNQERENIEALLSQLPSNFKEGWSFWEMFRTNDGRNWTTSLKSMEALMVLGIAIEKIRYVLPKEAWWSLPGGAPYVVVNN